MDNSIVSLNSDTVLQGSLTTTQFQYTMTTDNTPTPNSNKKGKMVKNP